MINQNHQISFLSDLSDPCLLPSYLILPSELRFGIEKLTHKEYEAIVPSKYEIKQLSIKELAQQMVNNALNFSPEYHERSTELNQLMNTWFVLSEDKRLFEEVVQSSDPKDNIWKLFAHTLAKPGERVNGDEVNILPISEDIHSGYKIIDTMVQNYIGLTGGVDFYIDLFHQLADHYQFVLSHPNLVGSFIHLIAGAISSTSTKETDDLLDEFVDLYDNLGMNYHSINVQLIKANRHMIGGRFEKAIKIYEIVEDYTSTHDFGIYRNAKNNRGIVLYVSGQIEQALEIYFDLLEDEPENSIFLNNVADCYARLGQLEKAWEYGQKFMEHTQTPVISGYEFLQPVLHDLGLEEEHEKFMEKMEQILEETDFDLNEVFIRLLRARQARYNLNMGDAIDNVNQGIDMCIEWKNLQALTPLMIEKLNIYIEFYELRPTENNKQRLYNSVNSLIQLCDDQGMASGSIEGLRLRAQIHLKFDNITEAKEDLYNATKLADQFDYQELYEETLAELEEIRAVDKIDEEKSDSIFLSLKKKLRQLVGLGGSNKEFKSKEYTTHGSIVMSNVGIPVFTNYLTDKLKKDSALISGLISAVSSMLNEVTESKGFLKTIQRDDFALLFEPVHDFLVISVVSDDCFEARQKLLNFSNRVKDILDDHEIGEFTSNIPKRLDEDINSAIAEILI